jgi:hypothetical protein
MSVLESYLAQLFLPLLSNEVEIVGKLWCECCKTLGHSYPAEAYQQISAKSWR